MLIGLGSVIVNDFEIKIIKTIMCPHIILILKLY